MIRVTVWNEYRKEFNPDYPEVKELFPDGMHNYIADFLHTADKEIITKTAYLDQPEHGMTEDVLGNTDVLIWWSHGFWNEVDDEIAERVKKHVLAGMGFIVLHSAHTAKPFTKLMGTTCSLRWREGSSERLWVCDPSHPIAKGIPQYVDIPVEEMYGEYFDVPKPDDIIFLGWFKSGEAIRAGLTFKRGLGKIFYFQPGHETYPTYHNPIIQKIITNAVKWAMPAVERKNLVCEKTEPLEN
ncbi:MAG: ThuA domain-containing protein [Alphaproteobacteria bacterium]|nr:ThuA domain-containing protein [Alphaproteobacteria bacterium]